MPQPVCLNDKNRNKLQVVLTNHPNYPIYNLQEYDELAICMFDMMVTGEQPLIRQTST